MIDIHSHILTGVDDGPTKIEDSMLMLDMAYRDGIRAMIATPHISHSCSAEDPGRIKFSYQQLKESAALKYPDMDIYLGCELFITSDYLKDLDKLKDDLCLHDTRSILIEFDRQIKASYMLDVIHEIKLRGFTPVVAHIEMYPCLLDHTSLIKEIRRSGAYTQITASSLLGKQGKEISSFLKKLISIGEIDFIATDAHSHLKRRPLLSEAAEYVRGKYGEDAANKIFFENPAKLLKGEKLSSNPVMPVKSSRFPSLNVAASVAAVLLLVFGFVYIYTSEGRSMAQTTELGSPSTTKALSEDDNISKVTDINAEETAEESIEADESETKSLADDSETITDDIVPAQASYIEQKYIQRLESLQANYESELNRLVGHIKISRSNIKDDQERQIIVEAFIDEIAQLESDSDNKVYKLLYDMQNELEKEGRQVASVEKLREEYFEIKSAKKSYYIDQLDM